MTFVTFVWYIVVFLLGTAMGSFINVVVDRYGSGRGVGGRSRCMSCQTMLTIREVVPVLSYVMLKGKCKSCKASFSLQHPLVEVLTGVAFIAIVASLSPLTSASLFSVGYMMIMTSIMIAIVAYDIKHLIIPDGMVYSFSLLAIAALFFNFSTNSFVLPTAWDMLAGLIWFVPFYLLWKVSKGRWIGLGDGKLAAGIAWSLGFMASTSALVISFWLGALVGLIGIALSKTMVHRSIPVLSFGAELPFAPFLALAWFLVLLTGLSALDLVHVALLGYSQL